MTLNRDIAMPVDPWRAMWALALCAVWLIPNFSAPWSTFDRELLAALVLLTLALFLAISVSARWMVPRLALLLTALCAVPLLQLASGLVLFRGDALIAVLYLIGLAISVVLGARLANRMADVWLRTFLWSIGLAAILSVGIVLYQWLDLDFASPWIIDVPPRARPFGNIGQPNLLATLLCWGLVAVWSGYLRKDIGGWVALMTGAFLLWGVAATQSRTGWIVIALFGVLAVVYSRPLGSRRYWKGLLFLAALFCVFVFTASLVSEALYLSAPASVEARAGAPSYRLQHWSLLLDGLRERPWAGWGWNQVSVAQQSLIASRAAAPELIHYSHDFLLDLLVWNGLPIGAGIIVFATWWFVRRMRALRDGAAVLMFMGICAFVLHALVEYPHAYAFLLLPVGIMIGALSSMTGERPAFAIPRWAFLSLLAGVSALTGWTAVEYYTAKQSSETLRFEAAHIGPGRNSLPPHLVLLTQLQALLTVDRLKLSPNMSADDVELFRKTAARYPSDRLLVHYAVAAASRGDIAAAQLSLVKLCKLYKPEDCEMARHTWARWGQDQYPFLQAVAFPSSLSTQHPQ